MSHDRADAEADEPLVYHNLSKGTHLHDVLELLIHVSEGELACRGHRGQRSFFM